MDRDDVIGTTVVRQGSVRVLYEAGARALLAETMKCAVEDFKDRRRMYRDEEPADAWSAVWFLFHCRPLAEYLGLDYNRTVAALLRERYGERRWREMAVTA